MNTVRSLTKLENIKKQTELKNKTAEIKNTLDGINRLHDTKEHNSDLEDREAKITQAEHEVELLLFF